jgi:prepilin-type N-terminal cleavage/methylation domain-containing protein
MNTCNTKKIASRGFTLIESLVAIFIFSLAIVGLMTVVSRGIAGTNAAANQVTAHFLAQEGLETARAIRDNEMIARLPAAIPRKKVR